ncbi:electron transport complex subunit RsxC [Agaribacter flavus]|uniref:Ion-translocating oxidoreductase complex subunit C n=1 Tax=Agaribacter flavus TaxID=1902781 RepID=A0ABV7FQ43_9ALTE
MFADFDLVMERLAAKRLWDFPGGVHPLDQKSLSNTENIADAPLPEKLFIPIKQHIGVDAELIVNIGDYVKTGQALTQSHSPFAVPIHASSSGTIVDITSHVAAHASGLEETTVVIAVDGKDNALNFEPLLDYTKCEKSELIEAICQAGISGMGGAGFPTHLKSNSNKPVEFLIINGVECEPYISADDRLMREHAWQIRQGIDVLVYLLSPKQVIVAIEDNKPEALETMSIACQQQDNYQVVSIPTKYPAGGEKQLIQVLTSREVPSNGLPIDVGCLMYNVGTCYAVADAIMEGKPLTKRVVTLTGNALTKPQNYWAYIGTPVADLLALAGYSPEKQAYPKVLMGGPMMGFTLSSVKIPIVKTTNCILAPADDELPSLEDERACIRCSACADACPVSLLPQQMFWYSKAKEYEKAEEYNLFDCIECGACAYVCPSEIPLVHYYRIAKSDIKQQKVDKEKAEKARIRFEARKTRLLKEKKARDEKHRLAAQARQQAMKSDSSAKDKIAAALARAKAKKAAVTNKASSTSEKPISQTNELSNAADKPTEPKADNTNAKDDKKAKIAAAIARAKAKKAQQQEKNKHE